MPIYTNPPNFPFQYSELKTVTAFPLTGAHPDVHGFGMPANPQPDQEQVNAVAAKFQAFYDGLALDEKLVMAVVIAQAAANAE